MFGKEVLALTKACGTAACATAVAGKNNKLIENAKLLLNLKKELKYSFR